MTELTDGALVGVVAAGTAPGDGGPIGVQKLVELGTLLHYCRGSGLRITVDPAVVRPRYG